MTLTDPAERLQQLEQELHSLKQEHETLQSQYMRIAADFDNFRKRQSRDQDDIRQQLVCSTLSEILPVVDNFERARQQLNPDGEEAQALHRSYHLNGKVLRHALVKVSMGPGPSADAEGG